MVGIASRDEASRTHIAVLASIGSERQVLGHAFDEPERQRLQARSYRPPLHVGLPGHVVLERVHQLVPQHVIGLGKPARKRQDHAALGAFGHAAGALADLAVEHVGLLEVRMRGIEDELLPAAEFMFQQL